MRPPADRDYDDDEDNDKEKRPLTPEEERAEEIADLRDELEWLIGERAARLKGPNTRSHWIRASERVFGGKLSLLAYPLALGAVAATYIHVGAALPLLLAAAGAVIAAFFAIAYGWEAIAAQRDWRKNKSQIIAGLDADIDEAKKELFKLGVSERGLGRR